MASVGRRVSWLLLLAFGLLALPGCFGWSQNPSYFPHLLRTGDIIPTHAKPVGPGYYANFDPYAVRLEVRPLQAVSPVQTQHVIVATVYGANNKPLRNRRIEWIVEGEGNIVEVDESGCHPGRGYKDGPRYGVSYTNYGTHQITRGNLDPKDDFMLRPGQTWCIVSSAVEGDTHVTAYAPGIANWDKRKMVVTCRWVDALWTFPEPAAVRAGSKHVFTTKVFRYTDKQPLANYRVRYRIVDGPPAVLLPRQTQEAVVVSDLSGNAQVGIMQKAPALGINKVEVEIIRPPDPTKPSGSGIIVAKGMTHVEWLAPQIELSIGGPGNVGVGQEIPYTIAVANTGKIASQSMEVNNPIPEGLQYVRSQPPAIADGKSLTWTLGTLPPGQSHQVQVVYRAVSPGTFQNCAMVTTEEGLKDQKCATTQVTEPRLKISLTGPDKGVVGVPISYNVTLQNPGSGVAQNVTLTANLSKGLEPQGLPADQKGTRVVTSGQGKLDPLESRSIPLTLIPTEPGKQIIQLSVTADGNLKDETSTVVDISVPQISVNLVGPKRRFVDRPAEWNITVANTGDVALNNVILRDPLPAQLIFESATEGGILKGNEVVWDLGTLPPRSQRLVRLTTRCGKVTGVVNHTVTAVSDFNLRESATAAIQIEGISAFSLEAIDIGDPVEVGKQMRYEVEVKNDGTKPMTQVEVIAKIPPQLRPVSARGPSANKIDGQMVRFSKVPSVAAGTSIKYVIEVQALKGGDGRFRVEMMADTLLQPLFDEESTTVIDSAAPLNATPLSVPTIGAPVPITPAAPGAQPKAVPIVPPPAVPPPPL